MLPASEFHVKTQTLILRGLRAMPRPMVRLLGGNPLAIDGFTLDPSLQVLTKLAARRSMDGLSLQQRRSAARKLFRLLNAPRHRDVRVRDDTFPRLVGSMPTESIPVRHYEPVGIGQHEPAILFFHQGGLVLLDLDTCDTFCTIMAAQCRARVISVDYRLCPEHPFPSAIDDALAAWEHVQQNAASLGIDPARVGIAGDSAGGFISAVVSQQLKLRHDAQPAAQLLIYPWVVTDNAPSGSMETCAETFPLSRETMEYFNGHVFTDGKGVDHPLANPLKTADISGLPPAVVVTAGFDPLRDQGDAYASRLAAANVAVTHRCYGSLCHGFIAMGNVSRAAEEASFEIAKDFASLLHTPK